MPPYVCPLCNGDGQRTLPGTQDQTAPTKVRCQACEGKGVLWSPGDYSAPLAPWPHPYPRWPSWYREPHIVYYGTVTNTASHLGENA